MEGSSIKKLSLLNKLGYGVGDLANGLSFGVSATFLLSFYTDVLGISAAAAGTLFLIARIWDAVNDPIMGSTADRIFARRTQRLRAKGRKVEKFRPYLLSGSWPVVLASIVMFLVPADMGIRLVWAYVTYITWGMAYTFVNIPYGSLAAVMTRDRVERSQLSVSRGLGGLIGTLLIRVIVPGFLVHYADNQARGYLSAMLVLGALAFASYLFCYFTVKETIEVREEMEDSFDLKKSFSAIAKNRPFLALSLATIVVLTGLLIQGTMTIYFFRENLNAIGQLGLSGASQILPLFLVAPLIPPLVRKLGVKKTCWVFSLLSSITLAVPLFLPSSVVSYLVWTALGAMFLVVPVMLVWAMVSDCIDYNEYLSGMRQEGSIYGLYSFVRKMGQAFGGFLSGVGLTVIGYAAGEVQSSETLFGIKFMSFGIPAIAMFIAFIAYYFIWNLTPEKRDEITAAISRTQGEKDEKEAP